MAEIPSDTCFICSFLLTSYSILLLLIYIRHIYDSSRVGVGGCGLISPLKEELCIMYHFERTLRKLFHQDALLSHSPRLLSCPGRQDMLCTAKTTNQIQFLEESLIKVCSPEIGGAKKCTPDRVIPVKTTKKNKKWCRARAQKKTDT